MPDPEVVSGATETTATDAAESSTTDTQTEAAAVETEVEERPDYRRLQREDPDLNAHIQREIARAIAKRERQQLRSTAKSAVESDDADAALKLAAQLAAQPDDDDEDQPHTAQWAAAANRVRPHLDRIFRLDSSGQVTNPDYVDLYNKVGKAEMDRRYAADPEAFLDWVTDQTDEIRFERRFKAKSKDLYKSGQIDADNTALRNGNNLPPSNAGTNGQSDDDFIKAYSEGRSDDHARWRKIARNL